MRPNLATPRDIRQYRIWLWMLLGFSILYILLDFSFNAALLNIASGFNIDEEGFRQVEVAGRTLSSIGCALVAFSLWRSRKRFSLRKTIFRFLLTMFTIAPLFYFGSEKAIEEWLVRPSTPEQRAIAHRLDLAKRLEMSGVSHYALYGAEMREEPYNVTAMTHAATFPLLAVLHPGASDYFTSDYIDRYYGEAVSQFVNLHALQSSADGYQIYLDSQDELKEVYQHYLNSGNEVQGMVQQIGDADFNSLWTTVRDELRSSWGQLEPVMQNAMRGAHSEADYMAKGLINTINAAKGSRSNTTLADIETESYIRRNLINRGYYGRKLVRKNGNVDFQRGIYSNPFADFCGGTGRIGRSCNPTYQQMYDFIWDYGNFDMWTSRHAQGWPITMQRYEDFLAAERTGREVRQRINSQLGIRLDSSFDSSFQGSPTVTRQYINTGINNTALDAWRGEMARLLGVSSRSMQDLQPGMDLPEFLAVEGIERAIRQHTKGYYSPQMHFDMTQSEFMDLVMRDIAEEMEAAVMQRYSRTVKDFSRTSAGVKDGLSAYRATIIPPVALFLSMFFSLIALVRLPLLIAEIIYIESNGQRKIHKVAGWLTVSGIVVMTLLPFLLVPGSQFEGGFLVSMAFADEVSPLLKGLYHWLYVTEPALYRVGQALLDITGMSNLEIIHISEHVDEMNWRG